MADSNSQAPSNPPQSIPAHYQIINRIGSGCYGDVEGVLDTRDNTYKAVKKELRKGSLDLELELYLFLGKTSFLPTLLRHNLAANPGYLVFSLEGKNLDQVYSENTRNGARFPPEQIMSIGYNILKSLRSLHLAGVVHRDLKFSNIVIGSPNKSPIVLLDLGISHKSLQPDGKRVYTGGPNLAFEEATFASLRVSCGSKPREMDDVHSVGYILLHLQRTFDMTKLARIIQICCKTDMKLDVGKFLFESDQFLLEPFRAIFGQDDEAFPRYTPMLDSFLSFPGFNPELCRSLNERKTN